MIPGLKSGIPRSVVIVIHGGCCYSLLGNAIVLHSQGNITRIWDETRERVWCTYSFALYENNVQCILSRTVGWSEVKCPKFKIWTKHRQFWLEHKNSPCDFEFITSVSCNDVTYFYLRLPFLSIKILCNALDNYLLCSHKTRLSWRCSHASPTDANEDSEFVLVETARSLQRWYDHDLQWSTTKEKQNNFYIKPAEYTRASLWGTELIKALPKTCLALYAKFIC